jgi:hypothetical protein
MGVHTVIQKNVKIDIDRTGKRYGCLVALERAGKTKHNRVFWKCRCDCGNELLVTSNNLHYKNSRSCGCGRQKLPLGQAAFNNIYRGYKATAKKKNIVFALTKEDFSFIANMNCFYCGGKPAQISKPGKYSGEFIYSGIDRINSDKGYTSDNIVPCCGTCNTMKNSLSVSEFKEHIKQIIEHRNWR